MPTGRGPLRIAFEDFLNTFGFGKRISEWVKGFMDDLEEEGRGYYNELTAHYGIGDVLGVNPATGGGGGSGTKRPFGLIGILFAVGGIFISIFTGGLAPIANLLRYQVDKRLHTWRGDPASLVEMQRRLPEFSGAFNQYLTDLGVNPTLVEGYKAATANLLTAINYEQLRLREFLSPDETKAKLNALGLLPEDQSGLDELVKLIPSPNDLISMAVREAWTDETVRRFEYDAGFGDIPQFKEWMKKQGYSEDWSLRYWRAHWQLPGVNQAYEMLHRLRSGPQQFTRDDMETLLKTADIPRFFRERLIAISYNPFTRVDIRRMFGAGVLNADEVYQAYLDIGYDADHARKLTDFTTRIEKAEEKGLTKDAILGAYKRGIFSSAQASDGLSQLGYAPDDVKFWLQLADYDIESTSIGDKLSAIQAKYEGGILTESTVVDALGPLNLNAERQQALIDVWTIRRNNRVALPSRSELDDLRRRVIVDDATYQEYLKRDGYAPEVIDFFSRRIDQVIAADAAAEAASAQAEQERVQRAERSTQYQKDSADLNVQIAQVRAGIADLQLALHDVTDEAQVKGMTDQISIYKNMIPQLQLAKAQLRYEFISPTPPA